MNERNPVTIGADLDAARYTLTQNIGLGRARKNNQFKCLIDFWADKFD